MKQFARLLKQAFFAPFWIMMGGGGTTDSSSGSRPLTAQERYSNLAGALGALSGQDVQFDGNGGVVNPNKVVGSAVNNLQGLGSYNQPAYVNASIQDPGAAQRMANGDYNRLEQNLLTSYTEPLKYELGKAQTQVDSDAAKRGIWSSGLAMRAQNDLADKFAPQLAAAAANAASQRYNMQQQDLNNANQYALNRANNLNQSQLTNAQMANSYNANLASNAYNAKWAPYNYLKDLYSGTGGTISSGTGGGWNFSI